MKQKAILSFILAMLYLFIMPAIIYPLKLVYFAPFIVILLVNRLSFLQIVLTSFLVGLISDLISDLFFGVHILNYIIASILAYRYKRFFNEKPISTALYSFVYCVFYVFFNYILLYVFEKNFSNSFTTLIIDLFLLCSLGAVYGFFMFAMPEKIYFDTLKKIKQIFRKRKRSRS
jgi:rod shape-determining protein MreD